MASVISFSPTSANQGQTVTITGTGYTNAAAVFFGADTSGNGGFAVTSFTIVDDSHITAVVGAGATGNVSVWGRAGIGSSTGFTYLGSVTGSGKVTQSAGVLTFTDTSTGITVTTRVLQILDSNGNVLTTINMGASTSTTYTITTDKYLTFVCTLNGFTTITVNYLSTYFYDVVYANTIAQAGCTCGSEQLNYTDISRQLRDSAVTFALFTNGAASQANITAANIYINGN